MVAIFALTTRRLRGAAALLIFFSLLAGCSWFSSSPPPPPPPTPLEKAHTAEDNLRQAKEELKKNYPEPQPHWKFEANAIEIRFKASRGLNNYMGEAHSLVISIYQMSDPNAFSTYLADRDKLTEIMDPHRFDKTVTAYDQLFLQPGEERIVHLDRAENTRYVALVAGYYGADPDQVTRLFEIPVNTTAGVRDIIANPARLNLNIYAGDNMIQQFGSN